MPTNNFNTQDIIERLYLVMPSKFTREDTSNLYAFFSGVSEVLKINTDLHDDLVNQTNLYTASGSYVDTYIEDLSGLGREEGESDEDYKQRYWNYTFKYNCSKAGIEQIVVDFMGKKPLSMYAVQKRGAYRNGRYYYNNGFASTYGSSTWDPYIAYIQFGRKPNKFILNDVCKAVEFAKASGVKIYLRYPQDNELEINTVAEFEEGTSERVVTE